jgi:hypothetical protein
MGEKASAIFVSYREKQQDALLAQLTKPKRALAACVQSNAREARFKSSKRQKRTVRKKPKKKKGLDESRPITLRGDQSFNQGGGTPKLF